MILIDIYRIALGLHSTDAIDSSTFVQMPLA